MRTIAVDDSIIPMGSSVYIPEFDGMPKGSGKHDGCFLAEDRGSKVVGMLEERLGEAAFIDFMRRIHAKYYFKVILVARESSFLQLTDCLTTTALVTQTR